MCLGLAGSLSSALGGLSELLTLNLTRNALSGTLPTSLGGLSKLRLLDLSACTRLQVCALIILLLPPKPKPAPLLPKVTHKACYTDQTAAVVLVYLPVSAGLPSPRLCKASPKSLGCRNFGPKRCHTVQALRSYSARPARVSVAEVLSPKLSPPQSTSPPPWWPVLHMSAGLRSDSAEPSQVAVAKVFSA